MEQNFLSCLFCFYIHSLSPGIIICFYNQKQANFVDSISFTRRYPLKELQFMVFINGVPQNHTPSLRVTFHLKCSQNPFPSAKAHLLKYLKQKEC